MPWSTEAGTNTRKGVQGRMSKSLEAESTGVFEISHKG